MIGMRSRAIRRLALIVVALATIGCDRITKHVAMTSLAGRPDRSYLADTVRVGYVENPGGFLSLGARLSASERMTLFTLATGLALVALIVLAIRRPGDGLSMWGLTLFLSGAASNWIDRIVRGTVVDFMNVGIGVIRTGIFNVADVAIMLGVAIFMLAEFRKVQETAREQ
jgi:signal peptidase II